MGTWFQALVGFALLFPMYARWPSSWNLSKGLTWGIRIAGWAGAVIYLMLFENAEGSGFDPNRRDIIIVILTNVAVFGSSSLDDIPEKYFASTGHHGGLGCSKTFIWERRMDRSMLECNPSPLLYPRWNDLLSPDCAPRFDCRRPAFKMDFTRLMSSSEKPALGQMES